jgi:hypothetical protein
LLSAKKIPAGKSGQIEVKIKTENLSGPVTKVIHITTNDPRNETIALSVQAVVEPEIGMSESSIYFENVPAGKEVRKEILLTIPAAKQIKILSVTSKDPEVTVKLEPVPGSNGKKYKLVATQRAVSKQGYHYGNIIIKTDSRMTPELAIYMLGTVVAPK